MRRSWLKRIFPKQLYHRFDILQKYRPISFEVLRQRYDVKLLENLSEIEAAKKLHAETYLRYGYITKDEIRDGIMHQTSDPYQFHANYFGVIDRDNGEIVAVARQIYNQEDAQLPVFQHVSLQKTYNHLHPSQTVEISAFVKKRGVDSRALLLLFHAMLQHSKTERHRYWLIACDTHVYARLKALFGPVIKKVGPKTFYMGSMVIPAEIDIDKAPWRLKLGYQISLPPIRQLRRFLYSSFTRPSERKIKAQKLTPQSIFWDAYSNAYDGLLFFYPYRHLVEHVASKVLELEPQTVLDLGCGTGNVSVEIISQTLNTKIDAVDWSPQMLTHLRHKTKDKRLSIYERDALLYLKQTRKKYDVIVMNNVLYTIKDREALWQLLSKRLNEGGHIVMANPFTGNSRALIKDHLNHRSLWSLLRPALMKVWLFDGFISVFGLAGSYDFTSRAALKSQLEINKFTIIGKIETCYGGHEKGVDLLVTARKSA